MDNPVALIDEMLEDHATIVKDVEGLEKACSDATALTHLSKADKDFSPGRLDRAEGVKNLQNTIEKCEKGVADHFSREETALLEVFKKHGDDASMSQFHTLLKQHQELKDRFAEATRRAGELVSGDIPGGQWNAAANDLLTFMNRTRKIIEEHASSEHKLFRELRSTVTQG